MTGVSRPIVKIEKNHTIEIKSVIQFKKNVFILMHIFFTMQKTVFVFVEKWITGKE